MGIPVSRREGEGKGAGNDSGIGFFPRPKHGLSFWTLQGKRKEVVIEGSEVGAKQISYSLPACRSSRRRQLGTTHVRLASLTPPLGVPTQEPRHTVEPVFPGAQLSLFHPGLAHQLCQCTPPLFLQAQEVKARPTASETWPRHLEGSFVFYLGQPG